MVQLSLSGLPLTADESRVFDFISSIGHLSFDNLQCYLGLSISRLDSALLSLLSSDRIVYVHSISGFGFESKSSFDHWNGVQCGVDPSSLYLEYKV